MLGEPAADAARRPLAQAAGVSVRLAGCVALIAVFAAAFAWFWPTLSVGFLSDDFAAVYYYDRHLGVVDWPRVFEEFWRPWYGVRDLYRPLVSLSIGMNLALDGFDPHPFHVTNVLLVATAATATAGLAALLAPQRPALAAVAAGAAFVLHPATVEPASWIAARTSGLEVAFSTLALAWFAALLRGRTTARWPCHLAVLLALLSKEGAVVLPFGLLAVDLLSGARWSWRRRLRLHAPAWGLVLVYLLWRKLLLGVFTTMAEGDGAGTRLPGLVQRLGELAAPPAPWPAASWCVAGPLLALVVGVVGGRGRILAAVAWAAVALLPTSQPAPLAAGFEGRFVYGALPALAVLLAQAIAVPQRRWLPAVVAVVVAYLVALGCTAHSLRGRYVRGGAAVALLQQRLWHAAATHADGRPLGVVGMAHADVGLQLLQPRLRTLLGLRPFAPVDHAVLPLLGMVPPPDPAAPELLGDGAPLAAVLAAGGAIATWQEAQQDFVVRRLAVGDEHELMADPGGGGRFAPAAKLSPLAAAALRVELPAGASRCELGLLADLPGEFAFGAHGATATTAAREFWFDLTRAVPLFVFDQLGQGFPGCWIRVDGAAAPAGTRVTLSPRLKQLSLPVPQRGAVVRLDELSSALRPPPAAHSLRCYLLLPTGIVTSDVAPGQALQLSQRAREQLVYARDVLSGCTVHCFWQTLPEHEGEPERSPLDWFEVR